MTAGAPTDPARDRGSVVVIALVVILLGGISMSALASFSIAISRALSTRLVGLDLERRADAALAVATSVLRRADPLMATCSGSTMTVDQTSVGIDCTNGSSPAGAVRAGLVTTLHSSTIAAQTLPTWAGGISDAVSGAVVINTGTLGSPSVSVLPDRRRSPSAVWTTHPATWVSYSASDEWMAPETRPPLPPVPLFERPGSQTSVGSCNVYFPGRYLGTSSLVLSGGHHYFTSGVYYFERTLLVSGGARVVMGHGTNSGCSSDLEAVLTSRSPKQHAISGSGVTLLFGAAARLVVQDSSLIMNERNGGSGPSIRTVGFGTSTSAVSIPADVVALDDGSMAPIASHSMIPPESSTPVTYRTSTLSPTSAIAVSVTLNGSQTTTNAFVIEGQIIVPHGGINLASTTSSYRIALSGGIVATRLTTSIPNAPAGAGSEFNVGAALPQTSARSVSIEAHATNGDRSVTSRAQFDVSNSGWTLVDRSRRHRRHFES